MLKKYLEFCKTAIALRMANDCGDDTAFFNAMLVFEMLMDGWPLHKIYETTEYSAMIEFINAGTNGKRKKGVQQ